MSAKARRILALINDPRNWDTMLQAMNKENMDAVSPVGGERTGNEGVKRNRQISADAKRYHMERRTEDRSSVKWNEDVVTF